MCKHFECGRFASSIDAQQTEAFTCKKPKKNEENVLFGSSPMPLEHSYEANQKLTEPCLTAKSMPRTTFELS